MTLVSAHLPDLHAVRLGRSDAPPRTMSELYQQVEDLLESLSAHPAAAEELGGDSQRLKRRLVALVDGLRLNFGTADARLFALASLSGGMFAGALDGALLFAVGERAPQPDLESAIPHLRHSTTLLWQNLERILDVGQSSWGEAHVDDLQLLSGYGKHQNRLSLDEAEQLEEHSRADRAKFQAFLLASFKAAYAMGVVDAAVMFVGGERPGAAPRSEI